MGKKVHPLGFRLSSTKKWKWSSAWFSTDKYSEYLHSDAKIRAYFAKFEKDALISEVKIARNVKSLVVTIYTARPSFLIKKGGKGIADISDDIKKITASEAVSINIRDVKNADIDPKVVGLSIATQIEKRFSYLRAMKKSVTSAMKAGAVGIKIKCSGRLAGAEIARSEMVREGRTSLHEIRNDVQYAYVTAKTVYGIIGIKVWVAKKRS